MEFSGKFILNTNEVFKKDQQPGAVIPAKEGRKLVGFYLPPELAKRIKVRAAMDEMEMSEVAEAALTQYLEKDKADDR